MPKAIKKFLVFSGLFIATLCTTTLAGADHWNYFAWTDYPDGKPPGFDWEWVLKGMWFSVPFLTFLTFHEFGHYIVARIHKVKTSLPYYLPFLWGGGVPMIGTMGAVIRLQQGARTKKQYFDIGIAGPLAGFVVGVILLVIGFTNLPENDSIYLIHPEYEELHSAHGVEYQDELESYYSEFFEEKRQAYTSDVRDSLYQTGDFEMLPEELPVQTVTYFGKNLLYMGLEWLLVPKDKIPPGGFEVMHYPFLFSGLFALLFTALNLIPVGQLDGGHILCGLVGFKRFTKWSPILFSVLVFWSGLGLGFLPLESNSYSVMLGVVVYLAILYGALIKVFSSPAKTVLVVLVICCLQLVLRVLIPELQGYYGWGLFLIILSRFIGVFHPPSLDEGSGLSKGRKVLGVCALIIFVLCFTPYPVELLEF